MGTARYPWGDGEHGYLVVSACRRTGYDFRQIYQVVPRAQILGIFIFARVAYGEVCLPCLPIAISARLSLPQPGR